jgi:hypothetical protein
MEDGESMTIITTLLCALSTACAAFAFGILFARSRYIAIIEKQTAFIDEILDLNKSLIIQAETKGEELAILKFQIEKEREKK